MPIQCRLRQPLDKFCRATSALLELPGPWAMCWCLSNSSESNRWQYSCTASMTCVQSWGICHTSVLSMFFLPSTQGLDCLRAAERQGVMQILQLRNLAARSCRVLSTSETPSPAPTEPLFAWQGIAALIALNILEQEQDLAKDGWGSANQLHAGIEAMRLGFSDALSFCSWPRGRADCKSLGHWLQHALHCKLAHW